MDLLQNANATSKSISDTKILADQYQPKHNLTQVVKSKAMNQNQNQNQKSEEESLKTPTSDEYKIPAPRSPPPPPQKRRRAAMKCVRKLEFFEHGTVIPTEQAVEELFTPSLDQLNSHKAFKRSASLAFDPLPIVTQIL